MPGDRAERHDRLYRDLSTLSRQPFGTARAFLRACAREAFVPAEPVDPLLVEIGLAQIPHDAFADLPTETAPPRSPPPPDEVFEAADQKFSAAVDRVSGAFPWIEHVPANPVMAQRIHRAVLELVGLSRVASSENDEFKEEAAARLSELEGRAALSKIAGLPRPAERPAACDPVHFTPALSSGGTGKFAAEGPPPPGGLAHVDQPVPEETTVSHESAAGWEAAEIEAWWESEKRGGRYDNPNGREAARFLCEDVGRWISHHPTQVDTEDCREIVRRLKSRAASRGRSLTNNSARTYLDYLNSYLWRAWKNRVVRDSGVRSEFPKKVSRTPVATAEQWNRIAVTAVGVETIVISFEWPNRRVEVRQARLADLHPDRGRFDARCKNGHDEVTDPDSPLTETQARTLRTYLPWRRSLASDRRCLEDDGHLLARRSWVKACDLETREERLLGFVLVGVSDHTVDRILHRAINRAFPDPKARPHLPGHSFRRGGVTTLRDRGASWDEIKEIVHHKHSSTTEGYYHSLRLRSRLPAVVRLLDPPTREA